MKSRDPLRPTASRSRILALVVLAAALLVALAWWKARSPDGSVARTPHPAGASAALPAATVDAFVALEAREAEVDRGIFARDRQAREFGAVIEDLWDSLNRSPDALAHLATLPLGSVSWNQAFPASEVAHGIRRLHHDEALSTPKPDWVALISRWRTEGWRLDQSEFRHLEFQPAEATHAARSTFEVSFHLSRPHPAHRAQLRGRLLVDWLGGASLSSAQVSLSPWELVHREGAPLFHTAATIEIEPMAKTSWIDPVLLHDLDANGQPEILLAARNQFLARQPDGTWQSQRLSAHHPGLIFTAVLGDFNGDARPDLLLAVRSGLILLAAGPSGTFDQLARAVWVAPEKLRYAQALTCGDVDLDGDLDVFLAQYRPPYVDGQMPRPYFDANDGPPAYLLLNQGDGTLRDATEASGLAPLRHRRTYSASFLDLDDDADLDLMVVSDFAGLDLHENDGHGRFRNRTSAWTDTPRAFGMAHAVADFDANGRYDLFMTGMPQPTAERLSHAGLERPGFESWAAERMPSTFGNRLFFRTHDGFRQRADTASVARAGWAWGATDADLDLDRFPDLHLVNGHETRASVRDFESEFWTHDIYVGDSTARPEVEAYFAAKFARTRALGWSYGGYDKNRLFLNRHGTNFLEIGHLAGVALQEDSRNTVAADLDADGDTDLITTTFEIWPRTRQTVRIFENRMPLNLRALSVRLVPTPGGATLPGTSVTLTDTDGRQQRPWITGNRYRSQDAPTLTFGLGALARPLHLEVRWPGGQISRFESPEIGRIHEAPAPAFQRRTSVPRGP